MQYVYDIMKVGQFKDQNRCTDSTDTHTYIMWNCAVGQQDKHGIRRQIWRQHRGNVMRDEKFR